MTTVTTTTVMTTTPRMTPPFEPLARPDARTLAAVMAWFSPAFPTGGFAYSHGLETARAEGALKDESALAAWLEGVLRFGAGWSDAVLMSCAHEAAHDMCALGEIAELAAALAPSRERLAESLGQGGAFVIAVRDSRPGLLPDALPDRLCHPVAAGAATGAIGADRESALVAYLNALAGNLIAAAIRLGSCGQSGGARVLARLGPTIAELARRASLATLDDLGGCAVASDIAAMRHETLDGRLFIS